MIVYLLVKMMFYKHVKHSGDGSYDSSRVHSYWIKTTMLWMCERHPHDDVIWSEQNVCRAVNTIYSQLRDYIRHWHLPSFFIVNDDAPHSGNDVITDDMRYSILKPDDRRQLQDKLLVVTSAIVANTDDYLPTVADVTGLMTKLQTPLDILRQAAQAAGHVVKRKQFTTNAVLIIFFIRCK